ncbi:MAG TPA: class I SAM-dependent methyltransferase [Mesorhizobium sp.]|jgi:SAM-dependent methyltransferase|uniref:class I SAM-dependent methyltransferase n=1 Tax=Mesorhizobium sp. TaxID=1871066 RepID=UPI002DDD71E0|nr:class I SAM-dependent methyltransferase [Mesorhizobium sp.]HEV2506200.1 class I SAM-dependent methyltransferase [Mesorhizobium sp.]
MTVDLLYADPALVDFYDLVNTGDTELRRCLALAGDVQSVLDLGCGTGQLATAFIDRRTVVGVDPAGAMLDVARRRPGGERVEWIEADARTVRLGRKFDLIVLTGHAFQIFLTREDRLAVLATISAHLAPDGHFLFDSRNPTVEAWREWTPERSEEEVRHPRFGMVKGWYDARIGLDGIVTYRTWYEVTATGQTLTAESKIAFPSKEEIAAGIEAAGLVTESWFGDWEGCAWTPASREIIPFGRLR